MDSLPNWEAVILTSRLLGSRGEELAFDISGPELVASEPDLFAWQLSVAVRMPSSVASLTQDICSTFYGELPDIAPLTRLLDRVPSARFVIDEQSFELQILEHQINSGPVSGFVVNCRYYSNNAGHDANWDSGVVDQLLIDPCPNAASVRFAFVVEFDALQSFHRELAADLSAGAIKDGSPGTTP
ncbi:hypothetical protein FHS27_005185 [Rhodopirellula rubra]|uniref:Uncharacterized protein n=1 Tax=Aporhodopirellula rubra TaxID=980271 RepID=A0A7W5E353_9BACT|nr:hypothetical protein [Aporhodopirellula rubra]MBB3209345.1 hypothetical protein [Aporhodopirellula rubra]